VTRGRSGAFRYGSWAGGRDPLEPPYDVAAALDEIGEAVLDGASARQALRDLLRRGADGLRGLDDLRRQVARRQRQARQRGRLDGTLEQARALLEQALEAERRELFPDPSDAARMRELELDALPDDTARAVQALKSYDWRSDAARQAYDAIGDLLRREVLDSQFRGMKAALENADPAAMQAVKDMLADLNAMLARTPAGSTRSSSSTTSWPARGAVSVGPRDAGGARRRPRPPGGGAAAPDGLAHPAAAPGARRADAGLPGPGPSVAAGPARRQPAQRPAGPAVGRQGADARRAGHGDGRRHDGARGAGRPGRPGVLAGPGLPGASLDDIDEDAVQRALGRGAVDDVAALRRIERELLEQGYLVRDGRGRLELSPRAVRRVGATALRKVFAEAGGRRAGRPRRPGRRRRGRGHRRQPGLGVRRRAAAGRRPHGAQRRPARWAPRRPGGAAVEDFEVVETERRTSAAVALLVDLSFSMELRGTWGTAKSTALALHSLVSTKYPQDAIQIIGFSDYAQVLTPEALAGLDAQRVQGTNLQHALVLAGRHLGKHPDSEPVVLVVTDGEPTAHLSRSGHAHFCWPPLPETLELTMAEVERVTRRGRDDQRLHAGRRAAAGGVRRAPRGPQRGPRLRAPTRAASGVRRERLPARARGRRRR
jgi:uncharacterized protein with von Willebrand factor type A (vWA) domain